MTSTSTWKYIIVATAIAGALGIGYAKRDAIGKIIASADKAATTTVVTQTTTPGENLQQIVRQVYDQSRPATAEDLTREITRLGEDFVVFTYQNSDAIVNGKYDTQLERIKQKVAGFLDEAGRNGEYQVGRLHGLLGERIDQFKKSLRRDICQPEIAAIKRSIDAELNTYLTTETKTQLAYDETKAALGTFTTQQRSELAGQLGLSRLGVSSDPGAYLIELKHKGLDQALKDVGEAFGVQITLEKGKPASQYAPNGGQ